MKRIVVLGSTGSVGKSVLGVVSHHPDKFRIVGLSAGSNVDLLKEQCREHPGALFALGDKSAHDSLSDDMLLRQCIGSGNGAMLDLISETGPDLVVNCLVGIIGLRPTLFSLRSGVPVALANKEAIVTGGEILIKESRKGGAPIIPIDSEHVGISQCLAGRNLDEVRKVYITASGGALRDKPMDEIGKACIEEVLHHPTWKMGDKITVDSATMLNKGLEVIEAHWLFGLPFEKIDIVIHPQSIIHSLVEFQDGSIIAQMSSPDMRLPVLYALSYPARVETDIVPSRITDFPGLTFSEVDIDRYPCLVLSLRVAREGGNAPTILNSADEEAVSAFLAGKVHFSKIYEIISRALDHVPRREVNSFDDIVSTDGITRKFVKEKFSI